MYCPPGGAGPECIICTLSDDLAEGRTPGTMPALTQVQVGADSPSFGAWSPDGKLLACTVLDRCDRTLSAGLVSRAASSCVQMLSVWVWSSANHMMCKDCRCGQPDRWKTDTVWLHCVCHNPQCQHKGARVSPHEGTPKPAKMMLLRSRTVLQDNMQNPAAHHEQLHSCPCIHEGSVSHAVQ